MELAEKKSQAPAGKLRVKFFERFLISPPTAGVGLDTSSEGKNGRARVQEVLKEMRERLAALNSVKNKLEGPDVRFRIESALRDTDLYAGLRWRLTKEYNCQLVTNAWLKLYEIVCQMRLLAPCGAPSKKELPPASDGAAGLPAARAFFNAELPGAFTCALNHYMKTVCPKMGYRWAASSFYPPAGSADALGDTYGLFACNRGNWVMDPPEAAPAAKLINGDVTDVDNLLGLAKRVREKFGGKGATLYTSDAGLDASGDYSRQEEAASLLNLGQIVSGLMTLEPGGDLVTKTFTFFTEFSISLLVLLSRLFHQLYITKPLTSRPANSEVYVVGKGFRGVDAATIKDLLGKISNGDTSKPLFDLDDSVLATVLEIRDAAIRIHSEQQTKFLEQAVAIAKHPDSALKKSLKGLARKSQDQWLKENPILEINTKDHLPSSQGAPRSDAKARAVQCERGVQSF